MGLSKRCVRCDGFLSLVHRTHAFKTSLQTPVYALYSVPTIVSAVILLTVRHYGISLPSSPPNCWWNLFDAEWEDVWSVCGYIMRLYRHRGVEDQARTMGMLGKKDVRKWLENNT
jgi:hypothetical protein